MTILETKLQQLRLEWTKYPERRANIELRAKLLLGAMERKMQLNLLVTPRQTVVEEDILETAKKIFGG